MGEDNLETIVFLNMESFEKVRLKRKKRKKSTSYQICFKVHRTVYFK